jgi:hypothetical protein
MSDNQPNDPRNEEVDLGQLFNAIGRLFEKLFSFIGSIFIKLFSLLIYALKPIVNNIKFIAIVLLLAGISGYVVQQFRTPVYQSDMLVRPYFDSKYQLDNNVKYFNALIGQGNIKELSKIFEIDSVQASSLKGFTMEAGPEDLMKEYDTYLKSIDSTLVTIVPYEEFVENRALLDANIFSITAMAKRRDVFIGLEEGFSKTFENEFSRQLREKRDDTIRLRKASLEKQLDQIDKLQRVYIDLIEKEAEQPEVTIGAEGMFPLQQTKRETKEYDLLQRELAIRTAINSLNEQLVKEDRYFDIISGFDEIGEYKPGLRNNFTILLPALAFLLMVTAFLLLRVFKFIKEYEN